LKSKKQKLIILNNFIPLSSSPNGIIFQNQGTVYRIRVSYDFIVPVGVTIQPEKQNAKISINKPIYVG
jgi:hypothetical protein